MDQIEKDILKWYNRNVYDRLGSDVSVTELLDSPRIVYLKNKFRSQIVKPDLNNLIPSLVGMGLHDGLQRYLKDESRVSGSWKVERKLLTVIDGIRVAGRFDALHNNETLYDIKVTTAWKFMKKDYEDWEKQLNAYAYMLLKDGITIKSLKIMGIVSDWQWKEVSNIMYPQSRIQILEMKKWSLREMEEFMRSRVKVFSTLKSLTGLPLCTTTERWAGAPAYKLYRTNSAKRATKLFPSRCRAEAYLDACLSRDPDKWKDGYIKKTAATPWKRCEGYCDVKDFCDQYKNKIEA